MPDSQAAVIPTMSAVSDDSKRVNVIFSKDQFDTLQKIASSQKITLSDALRQAINLSSLIVDTTAEKGQILLKKGDNVQELKLVR
jgi:hypothetical protein